MPSETSPATVPISAVMQRPLWRDTFSSLRLHNYRLYVIAQFIAYTAAWVQRIAVDWLVLELTGNVALVGLTIAIQFTPTIILGAYAGVIADRFDKRATLMVAQSIIGMLSLALAIITIMGVAQLWLVYLLVLLMGIIQVFDNPARAVFVNELVGPRHLRNAISLNASIFHSGAFLGPALSGALIVAAGSGWAIGINAVAVVIGVIILASMRKNELLIAPRAPESKGQIREAIRYIRAKPTLFWTMVMVFVVAVFGMPMPTLLAAMANTVYDTGASGYGLYNSLAAIGALLGALASARRASLRLRTIIFGAVLYGAMMMLAGIVPIYGMFLGVLIGIGLSRLLLMTAAETMVQLSSNLVIRGRVMAFWVMVILGGQAVGGPLMGTIAELWGAKLAFVIAGGVPAAVAIGIAIVLARSGRLTVKVAPRRAGRWVAIVPKHQSRAITEPITIVDAAAVPSESHGMKLRKLRSTLLRSSSKRRRERK
ncbi:MFS transporter [Salinibacterium sp. NSLL150]|uniref:MFS transporter n=1 Tax=unclassified Salinibacterium TaxID=2632331 RepID=UPI0018CE48CA|nr:MULTISPECIES: MFS transporter [unclassified Salinibacterium]MBH0099512.1 MFS transporter [Salinibacterium sp. NSLL35]MBH0102266.1 MFS transporter [Salinibacterium sp. NSLL150]MBH0105026.1 MFS transporter [Salinibacterium sp. NSLL16]MBH0107786.1 MFS transporter [Salinibacterium sp. NSLL17]